MKNNLLQRLLETLESNLLNLFQNHGSMTDYSIIDNKLTRSEALDMAMARQGLTSKAIARNLAISPETVSIHRRNIRKKLGLENKADGLYSYLDVIN